MRQRYSLTILTVIADLEINRFLRFQVLKIFYLESFPLSKVFIFFRVAREGANTLARFLQGGLPSTGIFAGNCCDFGMVFAVCRNGDLGRLVYKSGKIKN